MAAEVCQLGIVESEETDATTDAAAVVESVPVYAAGSRLEAVGSVGPGDNENSDLGAAAESTGVAGYHLA